MNKKLKITSLLLALVLFVCVPAFSATYYDNGSQRFTITAGPQLPVSVTDFSGGKTYVGWGLKENGETSFKPVGGFGSLAYQVFMNPYVAIGGEIGYGFNFYNDDTLLTNVPMLFKLTVVPLQGKFEIPLSLGVGISYMSVSPLGTWTQEWTVGHTRALHAEGALRPERASYRRPDNAFRHIQAVGGEER